jgi:Flp pilus assembly protein CpaB
MTTVASGPADTRSDAWAGLPTGRSRRRVRVPFGLAGAAVAGVLAFVLVLAGTRDQRAVAMVAVAARDLPIGAPVGTGDVRMVRLDRTSPLASELVDDEWLRRGWVTGVPVRAGAPLTRSSLMPPGGPQALRAMSVPVAAERAAGGGLRMGDTVDVIDVADGVATFVVRGAPVIDVASDGGGGIGSAPRSEFFVVVGVDAQASLRLAAAMADGKVDVVRSTGAAPAPDSAVTVPGPPVQNVSGGPTSGNRGG